MQQFKVNVFFHLFCAIKEVKKITECSARDFLALGIELERLQKLRQAASTREEKMRHAVEVLTDDAKKTTAIVWNEMVGLRKQSTEC